MKELLSRLSIQSFVLDLENEIQELPNLSIFDLKSDDPKTLIATLTKDDDLNTLFHKLSEHGIKVKSMRNEQNRLEELFIKLVKEKDGN
jgi:ABC-2 type transport system ATP-binding protein